MKRAKKILSTAAKALLFAAVVLCGSCGEELTTNKWSRMRAYYICNNVGTIPTLLNACSSPDQWCTVKWNTKRTQLIFESLYESSQVNLTALDGYKSFRIERGLIIGLPSLAEPGADAPIVTCYDIACPNCLDDAISKNLTIQEGGRARCPRCSRTYSLSNQGIVTEGERGKPLERYRVSYNGNALLVNN